MKTIPFLIKKVWDGFIHAGNDDENDHHDQHYDDDQDDSKNNHPENINTMIKIMTTMIILKTISPPGSRSGGQIATWQGKAPLTMPATKQPDVSLPLFCVFAF